MNEVSRAEAPIEAYDKIYETGVYNLPYAQSHYFPMYRATLKAVLLMGGQRVLEVGCGGGSFAQMLFDHTDIHYDGFDFSESAVQRACLRTGTPGAFHLGNALEPDSYGFDYDTIVCTEVLEHIESDRRVIELWRPGTNCICTVPNFDYETHVRHFLNEEDVHARYGDLIEIERIERVPRALFRGRSLVAYLRQLQWSRNEPKRFMALLGYKTFDNLAGWFVFSGKRR